MVRKKLLLVLMLCGVWYIDARKPRYIETADCPQRSRYPKPKTHKRGVDMGALTNFMWSKHSNMNPNVNALPTSGDTSYLYLD